MAPLFCQVAVDAPGLRVLDYRLLSPLEADGPVEDGPVEDGPVEDGPVEDGPVEDGPQEDGPSDLVAPGSWVVVPLGRRQMVGLVVGLSEAPSEGVPADRVKPIEAVCTSLPRLLEPDLRLIRFTAQYYLRGQGQVALTGLPSWLRQPKVHLPGRGGKRLVEGLLKPRERHPTPTTHSTPTLGTKGAPPPPPPSTPIGPSRPPLTAEQQAALQAMRNATKPCLLHGITGSGKSRLYIERVEDVLRMDPSHQALILVPEIGLTPVLAGRLREAFPAETIAVIHSGLTDRERAHQWLLAATGRARILVGTRMAVLCHLPGLALLVVDEEHDQSYKQQEGLRYSARDLAVWLAADRQIPLILGSATPSLESRAQVQRGRYEQIRLVRRATGAASARVRLIDLLTHRPKEGLSEPVREALAGTLARGQQALIFVNRRGWAPVLSCEACGWRQHCTACSVPAVLHRRKSGWQIICHHCGLQTRPPKACPDCGASDLQPLGRGAQQIEETLSQLFPEARLARLDRDAAHSSEILQETLRQAQIHEIDLIVGTQMVAKGHDLPGLQLVVVLEADAQLANPDFRAPELLLATLTQVAGRAGRHQGEATQAEVLIQTRTPAHPILQALAANDERAIEAAWQALLEERRVAGMPPYGHLAALRVAHVQPEKAEEAIAAAFQALGREAQARGGQVRVYPPVPRYPERQAGKTRLQIILESDSRPLLRGLLEIAQAWADDHRGVEAQLEIDPLSLT